MSHITMMPHEWWCSTWYCLILQWCHMSSDAPQDFVWHYSDATWAAMPHKILSDITMMHMSSDAPHYVVWYNSDAPHDYVWHYNDATWAMMPHIMLYDITVMPHMIMSDFTKCHMSSDATHYVVWYNSDAPHDYVWLYKMPHEQWCPTLCCMI